MTIRFIVPAIPVAQPRQRVAVIAGHAHNYTPAKHPVNAFKSAVQMAFSEACGNQPPLDGGVALSLMFVMPRTKNMIWKTKPMLRVYRMRGRSDWDNLAKSVCDALNGLAWHDDSQISGISIEVMIASGSEQPHVEVGIRKMTKQGIEL